MIQSFFTARTNILSIKLYTLVLYIFNIYLIIYLALLLGLVCYEYNFTNWVIFFFYCLFLNMVMNVYGRTDWLNKKLFREIIDIIISKKKMNLYRF